MHNPNKTKNRVPTDRELTSLRAIASRKKELLNGFDAQISVAQATYAEIVARHEKQLAVLESILSELAAAKQYMAMLQVQKATVDNEMNEICGVLHPIRRMPTETLRHIFEETLEASRRPKLWQAIQLSHVCQHWRAVALNAPTLWTNIVINFAKPLDYITEYWNWAAERVKMVPADISFYDIGGKLRAGDTPWIHDQWQRRKLAACSLLRIPIIHKLFIEAGYHYPTLEAFSMITEFPNGELESLGLSGQAPERLSEITSWDWSAFLHRFPASKALVLDYLGVLSFSQTTPFSLLQDLSIGSKTEFETLELLPLCPKLERLTIDGGSAFYRNHQNHTPITMSTLTTLKVTEYGDFSWDAPLKFPSLSTLVFDSIPGPPDEFFGFLTNHPSIFDLEIFTEQLDLTRLAAAAPQLTKLTLSLHEGSLNAFLDWTSTSLQGPAFPQLHVLELNWITLKLGEFDRFIQTRCLPATHEKSGLPSDCRPLQKWVVTLPKGYVASQFLAEATTNTENNSDTHKTCLSWL